MAQSSKDIQLLELKDTIAQLNNLISGLQKTIDNLNLQLANKDAELNYLKSKLFGSSSERFKTPIPGQLSLFEELNDDRTPELIEAEDIQVEAHKRTRKKKATYDEMFGSLPVKQVMINNLSPEELVCPECGTDMVAIGTEVVRTEVIFHKATLERIEYVATTYECPACKDTEEPQFIKDNDIAPLVPHSYVSASLATHVMYSKFINAMPYHRQEKDFHTQFGIKISRGTMAHWTIFCAENYFNPLIDYWHRCLSKRRFFGADETPIQVLKESDKRPQSKSYVWLFRSGDDGGAPIIIYKYHPTRNGDAAAEFFKDNPDDSYLIVDGFSEYNKLKRFRRCCCYAHLRRYFIEAISKGYEKDFTDPGVQGMLYCNKLFGYERTYREKGLSYKQIHNRRQRDQKPVVEAFLSWINKQNPSKGSRLDRAITYAKNQAPYMMTYLEDSRCELSNNLSENSIRPVTVGRRNWLFCDTTDGANASMAVYSLLETARANGLNPYKYMEYILEARPDERMTDKELEALSPWNENIKKLCEN